MSESIVNGFKSIVLTSQAPADTAAFYRDVLGLPLEEERHRGTDRHWACQVGSLHFAIHDRAGFWLATDGAKEPSETIVSFEVEDIARVETRGSARRVSRFCRVA